jgi:DNA-binding transcriptional LysR family regulator
LELVDTGNVTKSIDPSLSQVRALIELAQDANALGPDGGKRSLADRQKSWQAAYRLESYVRDVLGKNHTSIRLLAKGEGLTSSGATLLDVATKLVTASNAFRTAVEKLSDRPATVTLGCYPAHSPLVGYASRKLQSILDIQLVASDDSLRLDGGRNLATQVRDFQLDIAIAPSGTRAGGLTKTPLYGWNLIVVVSRDHPLYGANTVELRDLKAEHRLMASPPSHRTRDLLVEKGLTAPIWFSSPSVDALAGLAEAGQGAAILAGDSYPVRKASREAARNWPVLVHRSVPLQGSFDIVYRKGQSADRPIGRVIDSLVDAAAHEPSFKTNRFVWIPERSIHEAAERRPNQTFEASDSDTIASEQSDASQTPSNELAETR